METGDLIVLSNGIICTLITQHDNGSLQVRINRGQPGAGQIISVSEHDIEHVPQETQEEEHMEEHKEATIIHESNMHSKNYIVVIVIVVVIIFLVLVYIEKKGQMDNKPKSEIETLTEQLNGYNLADIKDIGSCKALKERQKEKKKILDKIQGMY